MAGDSTAVVFSYIRNAVGNPKLGYVFSIEFATIYHDVNIIGEDYVSFML